jgi:putative phosphoribosyl transferase
MNKTLQQNQQEHRVAIAAGSIVLEGTLSIPASAQGIVLFAHGSGSSRHSPRNRYVARVLRRAGLATLLFDLLTAEEEAIDLWSRQLRFDVDLLAERVIGATDWLKQNPIAAQFKIGYFGASTGSAAALLAATQRPNEVRAIVSRGGRPDLSHYVLSRVRAPTLLIVGEKDIPLIGINQDAFEELQTEKRLEIVPGATHLFEETGAIEEVAWLASQWFHHYL